MAIFLTFTRSLFKLLCIFLRVLQINCWNNFFREKTFLEYNDAQMQQLLFLITSMTWFPRIIFLWWIEFWKSLPSFLKTRGVKRYLSLKSLNILRRKKSRHKKLWNQQSFSHLERIGTKILSSNYTAAIPRNLYLIFFYYLCWGIL